MNHVEKKKHTQISVRLLAGLASVTLMIGCTPQHAEEKATKTTPPVTSKMPPPEVRDSNAQAAAAYTAQQKQGVEQFRQAVEKKK